MLSVIIPTRNCAESLPLLLSSLGAHVDDIVISDAGSDDDTLKCAVAGGARIALGSGGRGYQLARGARASNAQSSGDWMLFLHADSQLPEGWVESVTSHIQCRKDKAAYFRFALDEDGFFPRLMERIVALRCAVFSLPYGDQGLLISRAHYDECEGYPDWPLFEDVQIIKVIGRARLTRLGVKLTTSADKYRRYGYVRRSLKNICLILRFFAGTRPDVLARQYK